MVETKQLIFGVFFLFVGVPSCLSITPPHSFSSSCGGLGVTGNVTYQPFQEWEQAVMTSCNFSRRHLSLARMGAHRGAGAPHPWNLKKVSTVLVVLPSPPVKISAGALSCTYWDLLKNRTLSLGPTKVKFSHIGTYLGDINLDDFDKKCKTLSGYKSMSRRFGCLKGTNASSMVYNLTTQVSQSASLWARPFLWIFFQIMKTQAWVFLLHNRSDIWSNASRQYKMIA